jgi:putative FmdB family regulatory protein
MPIYSYQCASCRQNFEVFKKIADIDTPTYCPQGHGEASRQIKAPAVRGDYAGYLCPITGDMIEGKRAHQENLKRHGCRVFEPGETEALKRRKVAEEAAFDKSVEDTVGRLITEMPADKVEKLAAEAAISEINLTRI